jgi:hypothetical protein
VSLEDRPQLGQRLVVLGPTGDLLALDDRLERRRPHHLHGISDAEARTLSYLVTSERIRTATNTLTLTTVGDDVEVARLPGSAIDHGGTRRCTGDT